MRKTQRNHRMTVRLSEAAAAVLAEEAERNGCAPAEQARWLLVDAMTAAAQRRELQSIDAARRGQTEGEASHGL
jgi:hypothetical protein